MKPTPFQAALDRIGSKTPVGSSLTSAEYAALPLGLRERGIWTARQENVRTGATIQKLVTQALTPTVGAAQGGEVFMDKSKFVASMRAALGAAPGDSGKLTDITSSTRLSLIYRMNYDDALEHGRWKVGQDPVILDEYPAQELIREESRAKPRSWEQIWRSHNGPMPQGRMVALKDDPIWTKISRFGRPWPPFDFGSGMGLQEIDRAEAEALGIIKPGEVVPPQDKDFNQKMEASVSGLDDGAVSKIKTQFGDQVSITAGKARWVGPVGAYQPSATSPTSLGLIPGAFRSQLRDLGHETSPKTSYVIAPGAGTLAPEQLRAAPYVLDHPETVTKDGGRYDFSRTIPGLGILHVIVGKPGSGPVEIIRIFTTAP